MIKYTRRLNKFCDEYKNKSANAVLGKDNAHIIYELNESTSFLNVIIKKGTKGIKIRFHCVLNNIHEIPSCSNCTNLVKIDKSNDSTFTKYCSSECQSKGNTFDRSSIITEDLIKLRHMKMSYDAIGEYYGVSGQLISRIIKERNLEFPSLNCAMPHVVDKLSSYDIMYDLYVNQNKTCEDVAKVIGSSKAEVAKWLSKLNIEAKSSNSYDRKFNKRSKGEIEVYDVVKSIRNDALSSARSILSGYRELDILVPSCSLAIEFNGLLWHSMMFGNKDKFYHSNKTKECNEQGIELWHIFDDHWNDPTKRDIWTSRIHCKLKSDKVKRIHGRKCEIIEVSTNDKQLFMEENHLQGHDNAMFKYGLVHDGEIVAVMTFCKSRYNSLYAWELSRFAVKKYHHVNGAFSKLLKHFRKNNQDSIISYADKSYSNGNVYATNGFNLISELHHDYFYTKNYRVRYHKRGFTKKNIKSKCEFFDANLTEWQNMQMNGFDKVWTCGTKTYVLQ